MSSLGDLRKQIQDVKELLNKRGPFLLTMLNYPFDGRFVISFLCGNRRRRLCCDVSLVSSKMAARIDSMH